MGAGRLIAPIDYQDLHYYAAPKQRTGPASLDEVDPELLKTYEKLGIPLKERAILAGVIGAEGGIGGEQQHCSGRSVRQRVRGDDVPRDACPKSGVIFCPISEAIREHPESG